MSTDPALLWNAPPPPPRKPKPAERLWTLRKDGKQRDGELRGHGEYGWEFQMLHQGDLMYGHTWNLRASALEEADDMRQRLEREGWQRVLGESKIR